MIIGTVVLAAASAITLTAGVNQSWQTDPFTPSGIHSFSVGAPELGLQTQWRRWHVDVSGMWRPANPSEHTFAASVEYRIFRAEYWSAGFRHTAFSYSGIDLKTDRSARCGLVGIHVPISSWISAMASFGLYGNTYTSVFDDATSESQQPLSTDHRAIVSTQLLAQRTAASGRVRIGASLRYVHLLDAHSSYLPAGEFSAAVSADVRIMHFAKHPLFIGSTASLRPSKLLLVSDRSIDLHATWQVK